jgi:hypothetical protein
MIITHAGRTIELLANAHLGKPFIHGVPLHRRGDREKMVWADFERSVSKTSADFHINLGDLLDRPVVPYDVIVRTARIYAQAAKHRPETQFLILQGNHDVSRDLERVSAFDVFTEIVCGIPNVRVVREPVVVDGLLLVPFDPVTPTAELLKELGPSTEIAVGHWDVDSFGEDHNLIPTKLLAELGVKRRTELLALIDSKPRPSQPQLSPNEIKQHLVLVADRELHAGEWQRLKDVPQAEPPSKSVSDIALCKVANGQAAERQELEAKLATFVPPAHDWKALFAERSAYEGDLARYHVDVQRYAEWLVERQVKEQRNAELRLGLTPLPDLQRRLSDALSFEQQLTAYGVLRARFDELSSEVMAKRSTADEWRKVKDAMTILRGLVKQHLIPSLNRVASHLITGMTGGQRQSIVVDEDFDVTVDGQALDTLSGSGKAVANLALRLGLGQVLTNKVFSVFIGDEIDASLDQDRSENCATTLQAVKGWLSQIIPISHKTMPADYCIKTGS